MTLPPTEPQSAPRSRVLRPRLIVALLVLALAGAVAYRLWFTEQAATGQAGGPRAGRGGGANVEGPVPILASKAERRDMPVDIEGIGTIVAQNTVTVRPQVDGRLIALLFRDGDVVKAGDVLARIDPTLYQAQYDQALAKKAQDEALLANARRDLERYANLARTEYATQQQADTQKTVVAQLVAQVAADQAAIDNAKAVLDYATIRAPINGRTGLRLVDEGNLVRAADATGLVTIAQIQPIALIFNLPQQQLRAVQLAMTRGMVPVEARDADNVTVIDKGQLEVIDNQVDQTTGTVKLKARFDNPQLTLWPGQFVNVHMTVDTLKAVVSVPTSAIQRGPNGAYVYVIENGTKALQKPVTLLRQTESLTAIAEGLNDGDVVAINGFNRLTDNAQVRIDEPRATGGGGPRAPRPAGERPANAPARPQGNGG
jgi:multidrug efflux system membrane fusion protein